MLELFKSLIRYFKRVKLYDDIDFLNRIYYVSDWELPENSEVYIENLYEYLEGNIEEENDDNDSDGDIPVNLY